MPLVAAIARLLAGNQSSEAISTLENEDNGGEQQRE